MTVCPRTLLHVFPTFNVGGAQMRLAQLANHFGDRYRHRIVSMDGGREALGLIDGGIDVRLLSVPVRKGHTWTNLKTFRRVLGEIRPDLLVTSNWGSIEWALANRDGRVRHLHMEDGFGPDEAGGQIARRVWTRRLALCRATVMLPSMTLYDLARSVWRLPERRLVYVPNGVDCDRFAGSVDPTFAARVGLSGDGPVIGTVATLRAEKNLVRLIDAFVRLDHGPQARLAIVGDGPERPRLEARAADLDVAGRIVFTGACREIERLLPGFTVFALSSDTEQMPLSVLEAMASGLPVAATDVGDVRRMIAEENGPFAVAPDAGRLAEAIRTLLADPARAGAIGAANRRRAREVYDHHGMFAAYRRLFDG